MSQTRYPYVEKDAIETVKLTLKWLREGGADKREINSRAVIAASYALAIASGNSLVSEMP